MSDLTPIDRAALALVPLLVEARSLLQGTGLQADGDADDEICKAFDALIEAADKVSYRLLRKSVFRDDDNGCRTLMYKIDDAMEEMAQLTA